MNKLLFKLTYIKKRQTFSFLKNERKYEINKVKTLALSLMNSYPPEK